MDELGMKKLLKMYWENKIIVIIISIISIILGYVYTTFVKIPKYEATTQILFAKNIEKTEEEKQVITDTNTTDLKSTNTTKNTNTKKDTTSINDITNTNTAENNSTIEDKYANNKDSFEFSEVLIDTYIELIKSDAVIDKAIQKMGLESEKYKDEILDSLEVSRSSELSAILEIRAVNESPIMAKDISKNVSEAFLETIKEYYDMENAYIISEAKEASEPYNINHKLDVIAFFVVGFAITTLVILVKTMYKSEE